MTVPAGHKIDRSVESQEVIAVNPSAARELMAEIGKCYTRDVEESGEPNVLNIAALITSAFIRTQNTYNLAFGLADYICLSIDGANPRPEEWSSGK